MTPDCDNKQDDSLSTRRSPSNVSDQTAVVTEDVPPRGGGGGVQAHPGASVGWAGLVAEPVGESVPSVGTCPKRGGG